MGLGYERLAYAFVGKDGHRLSIQTKVLFSGPLPMKLACSFDSGAEFNPGALD